LIQLDDVEFDSLECRRHSSPNLGPRALPERQTSRRRPLSSIRHRGGVVEWRNGERPGRCTVGGKSSNTGAFPDGAPTPGSACAAPRGSTQDAIQPNTELVPGDPAAQRGASMAVTTIGRRASGAGLLSAAHHLPIDTLLSRLDCPAIDNRKVSIVSPLLASTSSLRDHSGPVSDGERSGRQLLEADRGQPCRATRKRCMAMR
jgi:hypothetical protein